MSEDKAALFLYYLRIFAPTETVAPEAEYHFSRCINRKHRADFCWPNQKLIVEVDGGQHSPHGGRHATDIDREKGNIAARLGYRVFHFSPDQLKADPEGCIDMVVKTLQGDKPC